MHRYITLYENTLSPKECNALIEKFERYTSFHDEHKIEANDGWRMSFTQVHLSRHKEFEEENRKLQQLFLDAIAMYKKEHDIQPHQWPHKFALEPIRMKRYLPDSGDMFDEHVEVTNLETAKRFMVMLIYLNDDFSGGETDFPQFQLKVIPKQGNMALFPAMWNWLHKGCPIEGKSPKYIVGSMMHYV